MAKPILIIKTSATMDTHLREELETGAALKTNNEYYVFIVYDPNAESIQFETHNVSDQTPIDIEELKSIINQPTK